MADDLTPLARALGRIPTGLYIVGCAPSEGPALGFLGSFLVQVGFEPPTICVAVAHGRDHLEAMRARKAFAVSILDEASKGLMGSFFKPAPEGQSPFDALSTADTPSGSPALADALAWLDCAWAGEHDTGDHVVVFGRVEAASLQREGDPLVHLRKNGLSY